MRKNQRKARPTKKKEIQCVPHEETNDDDDDDDLRIVHVYHPAGSFDAIYVLI